MKIASIVGLTVLVTAVGQASAADVFTDSASFLANVEAGYSFDGFDDIGRGPSPDLSRGMNGFAYDISAVGLGNEGLFNNAPGLISTAHALDSILVTFTSGNVTAVGGNFWSTDVDFNTVAATVRVTLSDGTVVDVASSSSSDFRGFTSNLIITSIRIDALEAVAGEPPYHWATMDNLHVGTVAVVPLPPAAWAGLGLLGVIGGARAIRRRG